MSKIYQKITDLIGGTPLLELANYEKKNNLEATVLGKLEYFNPAGSVKDRIAKAMVDEAEQEGKLKEGSVIIDKVRSEEPGFGFNALTEEYVNMVDNGILDPAKVTRSALQNATSVASTLLTTESVVATIKEDVPAMPAGNPGMGMM